MAGISTPTNVNFFEIAQAGTITLTKAAGAISANADVTHDLGYIPAFLSFLSTYSVGGTVISNSYYSQIPFIAPIDSSGTAADVGRIVEDLTTYADSTKFYADVQIPDWSGNTSKAPEIIYTIKYYLMRERVD